MTTTQRAEWVRIDGRSALRFERELAHSAERIWQAIIDPAEHTAWFPCRIDGDLGTVGAELRFVFSDDAPVSDEITRGTVLVSEHPSRLHFSWADQEIRIALEPLPDGGTQLVFIDLMPPTLEPTASRDAAGWHTCLDDLDDFLTTGVGKVGEHGLDTEWRALYDAYVADGVPHGAPLPDGTPLD
jgi:uncharacterized protein YndB with AHSA1/START domain